MGEGQPGAEHCLWSSDFLPRSVNCKYGAMHCFKEFHSWIFFFLKKNPNIVCSTISGSLGPYEQSQEIAPMFCVNTYILSIQACSEVCIIV